MMGKTAAVRRPGVERVKIEGRTLVIMPEDEYERLLDAVDAAEAARIASEESDRVLTWDEIRHDFTRNRIAEVRKSLGVTQKALAKKLRVKQSTVSRMEKPDANLTLATLRRVAKALSCEPHELLS